jgi:hypothetical protein
MFAEQKGPRQTCPGPRGFILPPWPGYPLLGCSPALPNSVSPGNFHDTQKRSGTYGPGPKPAKRAHRVQGGIERPTIGKIRSSTLLPLRGPSEITKRIPSIHRLVLTRPFVAGINAPRDKNVRGPKIPPPKRSSARYHPHVSTARLIAARKQRTKRHSSIVIGF